MRTKDASRQGREWDAILHTVRLGASGRTPMRLVIVGALVLVLAVWVAFSYLSPPAEEAPSGPPSATAEVSGPQLPAGMVGSWAGEVSQQGVDSYRAEVEVTGGGGGLARMGQTTFPDLNCIADQFLQSVTGSKVEVRELIVYDDARQRCSKTTDVTLELQDANTLHYSGKDFAAQLIRIVDPPVDESQYDWPAYGLTLRVGGDYPYRLRAVGYWDSVEGSGGPGFSQVPAPAGHKFVHLIVEFRNQQTDREILAPVLLPFHLEGAFSCNGQPTCQPRLNFESGYSPNPGELLPEDESHNTYLQPGQRYLLHVSAMVDEGLSVDSFRLVLGGDGTRGMPLLGLPKLF